MQTVLRLATVCFPCCAKTTDTESDVGSNFEYVVQNHYMYKVRKPVTNLQTDIPDEFKIADGISLHKQPIYRQVQYKGRMRSSQIHPEEESLTDGMPEGQNTGFNWRNNINAKEEVQVYFVKNKEIDLPSKMYDLTPNSVLSSLSKQLDLEKQVVCPDTITQFLEEESSCREKLKKDKSLISFKPLKQKDQFYQSPPTLRPVEETEIESESDVMKQSKEDSAPADWSDNDTTISSFLTNPSDRDKQDIIIKKSRTFKEAMELPEPKDVDRTLVWKLFLRQGSESK